MLERTLSHRERKDLASQIRRRVAGGEPITAIHREVETLYGLDELNKVDEIIAFQETDDCELAVSFILRHTTSLKGAMKYIFQMCLEVTGSIRAADSCAQSVLAAYADKDGREKSMAEYLEFLSQEVIFNDVDIIINFHPATGSVTPNLREVFIRLLQVDPLLVINRWPVFEDDGFLDYFHPDEFWKEKVGRYINTGDLERAWDELRRANRGFFPPGFKQNNFEPEYRGYFWATGETIQALVNDLYREARERGANLPEGVYGGRAYRWRQVKFVANRYALVPGFDVAYFSCSPVHEWKRRIESECYVKPEGRKALLLGEYFLRKRNERRRARNENKARRSRKGVI